MLKYVVVALLLCAFAASVYAQRGQNWAVIVSGSNQYYNYRHQADTCHAFQTLKKNGIPESNIIVFMYDDIANNAQNPKRGTIINVPNGPDVYSGVPKDYIGKDVTPENFLKVLRGEDMGGKKTIKSGPNDNIFVFWTDHGGPGIIAFPSAYLHAADLIDTLKTMYTNKRYNQLVFYLEACESGSMFNNILPSTWNIYVTTASNPFESSYACYYDNTVRAYVSDCYSINWMNDTDHANIRTETLAEQYATVKKLTTMSHVCEYGDTKINSQVLANFQGSHSLFRSPAPTPLPPLKEGDVVSSRDVKRVWLQRQIKDAAINNEQPTMWESELQKHNDEQERDDIRWGAFAHTMKLAELTPKVQSNDADHCYSKLAIDVDCMKAAVEASKNRCGLFTETSFKYAAYLRDACWAGYTPEEIDAKLSTICSRVL